MKVSAYLSFDGQCAEAFAFYEKCLGGTIEATMTYRGSPMEEHVPEALRDNVMHTRMSVHGVLLMGSDAPPGRYTAPSGMQVSLMVDQVAEAERVFSALAEGGRVDMPLQETFWSPRFGMLVDRFGTPWMVNCEPVPG